MMQYQDDIAKLASVSHDDFVYDRKSHLTVSLMPGATLGEDEVVLQPFVPLSQHTRTTITPGRICLVIICLAMSVVGVLYVPVEHFKVMLRDDNVASFDECRRVCETAHSHHAVVSSMGGRGVCSGVNDVVFKECCTENSESCRRITADTSLDPNRLVASTQCSFHYVPAVWMPYAVVSTFAIAITLVVQGYPPEVLLLGGAAVLSVLQIITPDQVFEGLSNGGVVSLAVLFPISEAITETGMLETAVSMMLGVPGSLPSALVRMMLPVALVSAFLSNTATVAMMIPIVGSWSRRLGVHPGKLLMPLSFAAQLGGCLTLLGGSQCLVAKAAVPVAVYSMQFFDLLPIGFLVMISTMVVIVVLASTPLLQSSMSSSQPESDALDMEAAQEVYTVMVIVKDRQPMFGGLVGKELADAAILRLDGVSAVCRSASSIATPSTASSAGTSESDVLMVNDRLEVECNEFGIVSLRQHPGLTLEIQPDLDKLGAQRRHRSLYEVCLSADSYLLSTGELKNASSVRDSLGACLVAVRAPRSKSDSAQVRVGSVLLFEADSRCVADSKHKWSSSFSLIRRIPASSPPRVGRSVDFWRGVAVCLGMIMLIGLVALGTVELHIGGVIFLLVLLVARGLTVQQLFESMKPRVLLTIVGALAMGTALQRTGVVTVISTCLQCAHGMLPVTAVIYVVSVFLSMFINNSATIAILMPVIISMAAADPTLNVKALVWALVYGAGSCFTTPLGYQTNLMVMADGEYSFADFMRFGSIVQLCHFAGTLLCICWVAPLIA